MDDSLVDVVHYSLPAREPRLPVGLVDRAAHPVNPVGNHAKVSHRHFLGALDVDHPAVGCEGEGLARRADLPWCLDPSTALEARWVGPGIDPDAIDPAGRGEDVEHDF